MNVHASTRIDADAASPIGAAEAEAFLKQNPQVQYIDCVFADICGNVRGKRIARSELEAVYRKGLPVPATIYFLDARGEVAGPSTTPGVAWPVPASLTTVNWSQRPHGQALMSLHDANGGPYFGEPRNVLARALDRFEDMNLIPVVGTSLQFHLLERSKGPPQKPAGLDAGRLEDVMAAIAEAAEAQHLPKFKWSSATPGQFTLTSTPQADVCRAGDHAVFLRQIVRAVARQHEIDATFMAKPFSNIAGNGLQVSVGLQHPTGETVFDVASAEGATLLRAAVGGLQALLAESIAFFAPNVNAYRRFTSEASAPRNKRWGFANRTANLSLPGTADEPQMINHRVAGADANPYLVLAAILAGVHHGIAQQLDPGAAFDGDAAGFVDETLPFTIDGALLTLENGSIMRGYLGPAYVDLYCATKRTELERFRAFIPPHEFDWYL
ncbi:MAG: glutamine synthetase [Alphaproteobacteria bacterium]|nr:glutamine synthetase [Alphaproteobacteria bacterium]